MQELFLPYTESLELKELGFEEKCFGYHGESGISRWLFIKSPNESANNSDGYISDAPLYTQAFKFFREKYKLDSFCRTIDDSGESYWKICKLYDDGNIKGYADFNDTYEEAELACIRKLIEITKQQKQ